MAKAARKPYDQRTDLEKIKSQWIKIAGLHSERQSSAAIVRCSTAAEIAANMAIRREFAAHTDFDGAIVDSFLIWANGLKGKMNNLLLPVRFGGNGKNTEFKKLNNLAQKINDQRNKIVHSGSFSKRKDAKELIGKAKEFVEMLVRHYEPGYRLPERKAPRKKRS
jgi:hypothetical protein